MSWLESKTNWEYDATIYYGFDHIYWKIPSAAAVLFSTENTYPEVNMPRSASKCHKNVSECASSRIKLKMTQLCVCARVRMCITSIMSIVFIFEFERVRETERRLGCTRGNNPFGKLMKVVNTGRGSHWQSKHFLERQALLYRQRAMLISTVRWLIKNNKANCWRKLFYCFL